MLMQSRLAITALILLAAGAAAAQNPRPLGRIAVLPSADLPMIQLDYLPPHGQTVGAAMQDSLGSCAIAPAGARKEDLIAALLFCPAWALGTGAVASVRNDPEKIGSAATAVAGIFSAERTLQARFGEEVARHAAQKFGARFVALPPGSPAPDYATLAAKGVDTVLEVGISEIRTLKIKGSVDPNLRLVMSASARVIDARSGEALTERLAVYWGEMYSRSRWTQDASKLLREDIERGTDELADYALEVGLLLYDFPPGEGHPARDDHATIVFGIEPDAPAAGRKWRRVESVQPELRWEGFPRAADQVAAPQDMARVRDVSYDIVIAEALGAHVGAVVYRRERIAQNAHRLESPLLARRNYYWSVRARFTLDGNEHVTEWGRMRLSDDLIEILTAGRVVLARPGVVHAGSVAAPYSGSYRFSTP
jgi:hypothetical protein